MFEKNSTHFTRNAHSNTENEFALGMLDYLVATDNDEQIKKTAKTKEAIQYLLKAAEYFDDINFEKQAKMVLAITSEEMVSNLKDHGTVLEKIPADFVPKKALKKAQDSNKAADDYIYDGHSFNECEEHSLCPQHKNNDLEVSEYDIPIDLHELGEKMLHWHAGQWDPIYMVGSFFIDGKDYPDLDVVENAKTNLESDLNKTEGEEDKEELAEIIDNLAMYLEEHNYDVVKNKQKQEDENDEIEARYNHSGSHVIEDEGDAKDNDKATAIE